MIEITSLCGQICLGKQGENLARRVYFDEPAMWKETFGEGKCELVHQRSGDEAPYPVVLNVEGDKVSWIITNADTAIIGEGKCELHYIVDNVVVKSKIWTTSVLQSLGDATGEPPKPQKAWVDQVLGAAKEVEENAQKVENATIHQPFIGENKNWFVWNIETQEYTDTGIIAEGKKGEQGIQGEKGEKGEKGADGKDSDISLSYTHNTFANALKGTSSGEVIGMHDVSPIEHEMGVKVWGKNLLNSNLRLTPRTDSGVTIQYLPEEDCYLLNGTSTDNVASHLYNDVFVNDYITITIKVVSGTIDNPSNDYTVLYVGGKNDINDSQSAWMDIHIEYDNDKTSTDVRKYISSTWFFFGKGITFNNYKIKIQIEKGTTATEYKPNVPDISAVKVMKLGKNLAYPYSSTISNGITFTKEYDGSVYIKGKATGFISYFFAIPYESILRENTTYRVSVSCSGTLPCDASPVFAFVEDGKQKWQQTVIWNKNCSNPLFYIQFYEGDEVDAHYYFQLEIGSTKTEYEPYIEPTEYTPDENGVVSGVTSLYPSTTLMTDTDGAVIDATYNKDINKAFEELENAILSLGGNV